MSGQDPRKLVQYGIERVTRNMVTLNIRLSQQRAFSQIDLSNRTQSMSVQDFKNRVFVKKKLSNILSKISYLVYNTKTFF